MRRSFVTAVAATFATLLFSSPASTQERTAVAPGSGMIRQLWFGYLNGVDKLEGERWYYRYHAPEFIAWYGPWLRRYETYQAIDPPAEAVTQYGARPGKYTEMWWGSVAELADARSIAARPYTQGNWTVGVDGILTAMTLIPAYPTEDFLEKEPSRESPIVRWFRVMRYPEGVTQEQGDAWYLKQVAPVLKQVPGLTRYVSYKTVEFQQRRTTGAYRHWHRVDELWFTDMASWKKAFLDAPPNVPAPPWAKKNEAAVEMYSDFVRISADVNFLKDLPKSP